MTILSDILVENDEVFLVRLSTDDPSVVLNPNQAEIMIIDNDGELFPGLDQCRIFQ